MDFLQLCRHVNIMSLDNATTQTFTLSNNSYDFLGKSSDAKFSAQGDSIIYKNGPS